MALRCVDASFVVAWLVPSQQTPAVVEAWTAYINGRDEYIGPSLLYPEVISSIRRLAHRGLLAHDVAWGLIDDFLALEIPASSPDGLYRQAYELAAHYNQSRAYDTCYLALASLLSCSLLTLDGRFYQAVARDFPLVTLVR